ncbi:MAG: hypothetical protein AAGA40_11490 [Cyanobacteria bacterium P01_E01_bin.45]
MNKFESRPSQPKLDTDEGWVVQVYGRNRRLFCVLYPSQGWLFLLGCSVGLLLAVIWITVARYSPPSETTTPTPSSPTDSPILQVN